MASLEPVMDPIAHTLVGASLARTGLGRTSRFATAALIAGANLPDIDAVATFGGADVSLWLRRGWTHGVPALLLLPVVLTAILVALDRLRGPRDGPPLRPGVLLGLSYFATWTHPTLDWMNTYGMRWLMPMDGTWFYGDTLFIIDPWIWTVLGGALFLGRERKPASFVVYGALVLFAGFLLFSSVPGLLPAKIAWVVAVAAIVALRTWAVARSEPGSRRVAIGGLTALILYVTTLGAATRYARGQIVETMTERGFVVERLMAGPVPVTPFLRDVVIQTEEGYRHGRARLWPEFSLELAPTTLPLLEDSPVIRAAAASREVRGFMNWARFPHVEVEETESGYVVYFSDARYTRSRGSGFGSASVEVAREAVD